MLSLPKCAIIFLVVTTHVLEIAGVAEWQTQQTQNLPGATSCRFKSGHRHKRSYLFSFFFCAQTHIETEQLTRQLLCFLTIILRYMVESLFDSAQFTLKNIHPNGKHFLFIVYFHRFMQIS